MARKYLYGDGNWRFKGLMAAAIGGPAAERELAEAWPGGNSSDYKFLSSEQRQNPRTAADLSYNPKWSEGGSDSRTMSAAKDNLDSADARTLEEGGGVSTDKIIKRTLLNDSITELDTLFREQLLDTVIMGAEPRKIARDAANVVNVETSKGDLPRGSSQTYADEIPPGGEIETDEENFDTVPYNTTKIGQGFGVNDELIDQTSVDVIERNVRFSGAAVENKINRIWLSNLVDNAGNNHDTAGTNQDVTMVNKAIETIELDDYDPVDTLVMHPSFKTSLFEDSNLVYANRAGSDSALADREYSPLMGVQMFGASGGTYSGSNSWDFSADADLGGVVFNSDFNSVVLYQDLTTKDFEDPIRDITGGNVRAHVDSVNHWDNAVATIQY